MRHKVIQNRYRLLKTLGTGGMGEVLLAEDRLKANRRVALKTIRPDISYYDELVDYFRTEFNVLRELSHPNLASVYDFGYDKKRKEHFFTTEYVEGTELLHASEKLSANQLYEIIVQMCRALEYVHSHGIIHYDIKPQHILVAGRAPKLTAKVIDFGLAAEVQTESGLPVRGTPAYMAPEIVRGDIVDHRADLYSLGATLFHVLCGKAPFEGKSAVSILRQHVEEIPEFPKRPGKRIPAPLRELTLKLLAKEPSERYQSANEVIEAINSLAKKEYEVETVETRKSYILSSRFVGRRRELEQLKERFEELGAGKLQKFLILVSGEEGTGKSRLLREFKHHVQLSDTPCFFGETGTAAGLGPFADILRQLVISLGARSALVGKFASYLVNFVPEVARGRKIKKLAPLGAREEKTRLLDNLAQFVMAASSGKKFVFLIEDIDTADSLSRDFLEYLARAEALSAERKKPADMMICATCTQMDNLLTRILKEEYAEQVGVKDLTEAEVEALIGSMIPLGKDAKPLVKKVFSVTGGKPLLVEEVMKTLVEEGSIKHRRGRWHVDAQKVVLPKTLSSVVSRRLSRLSRRALSVLRTIAAFNRKAPARMLAEVTGGSGISAALVELREARLVVRRRGGYDLIQPYLGQMVVSRMRPKPLKMLHDKIGSVLEKEYEGKADEHLEEIAYHYLRGSNKGKAYEFGMRAAEKFSRSYANEAVIDCCKRVLSFLDKTEVKKRLEVSRKFGETLELVGKYEQARKVYVSLLRLGGLSSLQEAEVQKKIGDVYCQRGQYKPALAACTKALRHTQKTKKPTRLLAEIYNLMGSIEFEQADYAAAEKRFLKSMKIRKSAGNSIGVGDSLNNLGLLYTLRSNEAKAEQCYRRSLQLYRNAGEQGRIGTSHLNLGIFYARIGRFAQAARHYSRSLSIQERIGDKWGVITARINMGTILAPMGDYQRALDLFEESLKASKGIDIIQGIVFSLVNIGRVYLQIGDQGKLRKVLKEVLEYPGQSLPLPVEVQANLDLGTGYLHSGEVEKAHKYLLIALERAEKADEKRLYAETTLILAEMHFRLGFREKCRELCEEALAKVAGIGARDIQAWAQIAQGKCYAAESEWRRARILQERSLKTGRKLKRPELVQNASYELARVYKNLDNTKKARELYLVAKKSIQEVADKLDKELRTTYLSAPLRKAILETAGTPGAVEDEDIIVKKEILSEAGIGPNLLTRDGITLLGMVSRIMSAGLDPGKMLDLALGILLEVTRAQRGFIILVDEQGRLSHRAARNIEDDEIDAPDFSRSIVQQVLKSGQSRLVEDALGDKRLRQFQSVIDLKLRSVLCAPVKDKDAVLGAVYLDNTSLAKQFVEEDKALVEAFAEKIAVPLRMSLEHERQAQKIERLQGELQTRYQYENIVGRSKAMQKVFKLLDKVIPTGLNVHIYGETGTGKELVAKAIHYNGPRKEKPFVSVNCGGLPESLLESELFGHVKGAFTGADRDKKGLFEIADGGTLFLDEIGNMSEAMQVRMLRVLEEKRIRPVGGEEATEIDVRIVSATNRVLRELVERGKFREDLYYRLKVVEIALPPLRERREDILLLVEYFLEQAAKEGEKPKELEPASLELLLEHGWPGNVRELENLIGTLALFEYRRITQAHVRSNLPTKGGTVFPLSTLRENGLPSLEELERDYVKEVLRIHGGNKSRTARALGISRDRLRRKLSELPE